MKINQLHENQGNLKQLKLGKLFDILKQNSYTGNKIGNKMANTYNGPGNTSEVHDAGQVKAGIKDIRKAYRTFESGNNVEPVAFALYIGTTTVAFGVYGADALRTKNDEGMFGYDLTEFQDVIDAKDQAEQEDMPDYQRRNTSPTKSTSHGYDKKGYQSYGHNGPAEHQRTAGQSKSVGEMVQVIELIQQVANTVNSPLTMKLVTNDRAGIERRRDRNMQRADVVDAADDLKSRLLKFKNSKRPSADNIHKFIEMVMNKEAAKIQFAGQTYHGEPSKDKYSSKTIDPVDLMSGKPFDMTYKDAGPREGYGSGPEVKLSFRFNPATNTITPWQAKYTEKVNDKKVDQVIPIDDEFWIKNTLGVESMDKPVVIRKMLTIIKDDATHRELKRIKAIIRILRKMGLDWPELGMIEKSADKELASAE